MPTKAKDDLGNAGDLGAMDKIRAVKNTATNAKQLAKLPGMVAAFKDSIMDAVKSLQGAGKELNAKKGQLTDIGKKCNESKLSSAKDCYLAHGDKIDDGGDAKKKHAVQQKKKKAKQAPKAKK
mmetsp:Transcript_10327/g.11778  ORF Transcript_10327/g.11778 Transcript_10327/m.11778 type:complete len:123 (-) Transcript_10327:62-430(-)